MCYMLFPVSSPNDDKLREANWLLKGLTGKAEFQTQALHHQAEPWTPRFPSGSEAPGKK